MSWWDTTNLTNFASQALKTATKKIDKVLDIKNEDEAQLEDVSACSSAALPNPQMTDSFFSNWLGGDPNLTATPSSPPSEDSSPIITHSAIEAKKSSSSSSSSSSFSTAIKTRQLSSSGKSATANSSASVKPTVSEIRSTAASHSANELNDFFEHGLSDEISPVKKVTLTTKQSRKSLDVVRPSSSGTNSATLSDNTIQTSDGKVKLLTSSMPAVPESHFMDELTKVRSVGSLKSSLDRSVTSAFDMIRTRDSGGGGNNTTTSPSERGPEMTKLESKKKKVPTATLR